MDEITVRDLRNHGADVLDRVTRGEALTVTRDGRPVAELRPLSRKPLSAAVLLRHWQHLPHVDDVRLKADIDALIGEGL
jgi:prevent-host-death family protein